MNDQEQEMREAFKIFDKDNNKKISSSELSSVFRSLGYNFTDQDIKNMLKDIDKDAEGNLNFEEFTKLLRKQEEKLTLGEDELIDAFRVFDRDGNGVITAEELKQVMCSLGESLSDEDIDEMIRIGSGDADIKYVTLKDFVSMYLVYYHQCIKRNEIKNNYIYVFLYFKTSDILILMFVTQGQIPQMASQPQQQASRQTRDQQKKAFLEILQEANESKDEQQLERISHDLEEAAFVLSKGENTREYRTRVNTIKMRMKGVGGALLRQTLFDNILTASEIMAMDMNKLSKEYIQQYLKDNKKYVQQQDAPAQQDQIQTQKSNLRPGQTRPTAPAQRPGPPQISQRSQAIVQEQQNPPQQQQTSQSQPIQTQILKSQDVIHSTQQQYEQAQEDPYVYDLEFEPPREEPFEDLSVQRSIEKEDKNFLQMQKNIDGMKKLAEQLDDEFEDEYQQGLERSGEDQQEKGAYKGYTGVVPLASDNVLNLEFIKDDPEEQSCSPSHGDLLDQEIKEQEQDYYEEDQELNQQYDQQGEDQTKEQDPMDYPSSQVQNQILPQQQQNQQVNKFVNSNIEVLPTINKLPAYNQNSQINSQKAPPIQLHVIQSSEVVPTPTTHNQPNPSTLPQIEQLNNQLPMKTKPTISNLQTNAPFVFTQEPLLINQVINQDHQELNSNQVTQAVFDKLIQQRDQFYEQQLLEQQKITQHLQNEIHQIMLNSTKQLNAANQKNQQLQQSNSMLKVENEAVQGELQNIRNQSLLQLNTLQQAFEQERQSWNEEREVLLNIQQSSNFEEEIGYLQNEQNQLANMLSEYQKKNRDKNDTIVNLLKSRTTDVDKFNENLNQFRLLLIKLHPNTQWKAAEQNPAGSNSDIRFQTQQSRPYNQQRQPNLPQQTEEPEQIQRNPEPTRFQQVDARGSQNQEVRVFSGQQPHEDFTNQQNRFGDSGSTQTQNHFEELGGRQVSRRTDEQDQLQEDAHENQVVVEQVRQVLPPPKKQAQQVQVQAQAQGTINTQVFGHPKLMNKKAELEKAPVKVMKATDPFIEPIQLVGQSTTNLFQDDDRQSQNNFFEDQQSEGVYSLQSSQQHFEIPTVNNDQKKKNQDVNPPVVQQQRQQQPKPQSRRQQVPGQLFD